MPISTTWAEILQTWTKRGPKNNVTGHKPNLRASFRDFESFHEYTVLKTSTCTGNHTAGLILNQGDHLYKLDREPPCHV